MAGFSVQTTLLLNDWRAYARAVGKRASNRRTSYRPWMRFLILGALISVSIGVPSTSIGQSLHYGEISLATVAALLLVGARMFFLRRNHMPDSNGLLLGPVEFVFSGDGIQQLRPLSNSKTHWSLLQEITSTREHIFLWVDRIGGYIVPVRNLPSDLTLDAAVAEIGRLAIEGGAKMVSDGPGEWPASPSAVQSQGGEVVHRPLSPFAAVAHLYTFRSFRLAVVSERAIVALGAIATGWWVFLDYWAHGPSSEFWPSGLAGVAWYLLAALGISWVTARRCIPEAPLPFTLWITGALSFLVIGGVWWSGHNFAPLYGWAVLIATALLATIYADRALKVATGRPQPRALTVGIALVILVCVASDRLGVSSILWFQVPQADDSVAGWRASERLLFDQPERIDAAVARLAPATGSEPVAYMIGFAGVAEQRVFAEEIRLASRVLGARYGSTRRAVLLINDRRNVDEYPLATVSGLRRTLREVGNRMNRERDVLFLVLSSHGSEDPSVSVSNGSLPLNQLTGSDLSEVLRDSGIHWKVIIISACHAGAFIPALQGPDTIILAAAAADRTSFGCSDDRSLTYFGEAFFRDALPGAASLKDAFEQAKTTLAARERAEHFSPSNPQAFFGSDIIDKLADMDRGPEHPISLGAVGR